MQDPASGCTCPCPSSSFTPVCPSKALATPVTSDQSVVGSGAELLVWAQGTSHMCTALVATMVGDGNMKRGGHGHVEDVTHARTSSQVPHVHRPCPPTLHAGYCWWYFPDSVSGSLIVSAAGSSCHACGTGCNGDESCTFWAWMDGDNNLFPTTGAWDCAPSDTGE